MSDQVNSRLHRLAPITTWLPCYERSWLRLDVIAGLTVWALVVPQAIAYAQIAGLPPQAGVFAAFAAPLAYAIFGTSRQLVVSPTSATAAISAALVGPLVLAGDGHSFAEHSAALAILCGIGFLILGRFNMGFLSQFITPAVQTGFLIGLGLTIIVGQVFDLLGTSSKDGPFYQQFIYLIKHLDETNGWTMAIGLAGLGAILVLRRVLPNIPTALVLVVLSIVVVSLFNLDDKGVDVVGQVDRAIPTPALPTIPFHDWLVLVPGVLAIVVIGYSESMSVTRNFANEHRYRVDSNQELIALGASSLAGGLFQGFITAGGASQSAANDRAGAKTQVSSIVLAGLALLSSIALLPLFKNLPQTILAAIVITAVMGFVNLAAIRQLRTLRNDSFALAISAMVATLFLGILPGLLISIAISICMVLARLSRPRVTTVSEDSTRQSIVLRPESALMSFNSVWIQDEVLLRVEQSGANSVALDLSHSESLDIGGVNLLSDLARQLSDDDKDFALINVETRARSVLARAELTDLIDDGIAKTD